MASDDSKQRGGAISSPDSDGEVSSTRLAIGAVSTIIALEVAAERTAELPGMLPELVDAALVPWLGTARAVGLAER